jgi:hypothetical protein
VNRGSLLIEHSPIADSQVETCSFASALGLVVRANKAIKVLLNQSENSLKLFGYKPKIPYDSLLYQFCRQLPRFLFGFRNTCHDASSSKSNQFLA